MNLTFPHTSSLLNNVLRSVSFLTIYMYRFGKNNFFPMGKMAILNEVHKSAFPRGDFMGHFF